MKRYSSLEDTRFEVSSSKSVHSEYSQGCGASILKDPSRSKLNHNKSVHFEDFDALSGEESLESKSFCQQQTRENAKSRQIFSQYSQIGRKYPNVNTIANAQSNPFTQNKFSKKDEVDPDFSCNKKHFIKINPKNKIKKSKIKSNSPKPILNAISFGFRDKKFYENLNRFIAVKSSASPVRNGNELIVANSVQSNVIERQRRHLASKSYDFDVMKVPQFQKIILQEPRKGIARVFPQINDKKAIQLNVRYMKP